MEQDIKLLSKYLTPHKVSLSDMEYVNYFSQYGILDININLEELSIEAKVNAAYQWIIKE